MKSLQIAIFGFGFSPHHTNHALKDSILMFRILGRLGHRVTFYEDDNHGRGERTECEDPDGVRTVTYPVHDYVGVFECLEEAAAADVIVKATGDGPFDQLLDMAVLEIKKPEAIVVFLDLDAHATLNRIRRDPADPLMTLIPGYDLILTTGGGMPVLSAYKALNARECIPLWGVMNPSAGHSPIGFPQAKAFEYLLSGYLAVTGAVPA